MNPIQEQAVYELYLTDVMGTTTPKSEITKVTDYILANKQVQEQISQKTGQENIEDVINKGLERNKKGQKDHPEFKEYLKVWDIGAQIAYRTGEFAMSLEDDVEGALERIHDSGGKIAIYSSGAVETTKLGMESNGLDRLVDNYYSSSQPEIGSKFKTKAYKEIAQQENIDASNMVYVTDDVKEAQAAVEAGAGKVYFIDRKAKELGPKDGYHIINNYHQVADDTLQKDNKPTGEQKAEA
ncbi:MAG: HAD hydrolase-like protein [Nanoarchaeota archaeon]|nr:HAD hydrolase-like protein [Nanoarchaeota archaeon]